jgi:hypothetical protein
MIAIEYPLNHTLTHPLSTATIAQVCVAHSVPTHSLAHLHNTHSLTFSSSATIAQVHVAYLKDGGGKVAVKVQCPGSEVGQCRLTPGRKRLMSALEI